MDTVFAWVFPAGTVVYEGEVANQGGIFVGGTSQSVIVKPWDIDEAQRKLVDSWPLR